MFFFSAIKKYLRFLWHSLPCSIWNHKRRLDHATSRSKGKTKINLKQIFLWRKLRIILAATSPHFQNWKSTPFYEQLNAFGLNFSLLEGVQLNGIILNQPQVIFIFPNSILASINLKLIQCYSSRIPYFIHWTNFEFLSWTHLGRRKLSTFSFRFERTFKSLSPNDLCD